MRKGWAALLGCSPLAYLRKLYTRARYIYGRSYGRVAMGFSSFGLWVLMLVHGIAGGLIRV